MSNLQCGQRLSTLGIPKLDRLLVVFAAGHDETLLWVPMDTLDVRTVTTQDLLFLATVKVKHSQRTVVAAGDKLIVRWAETGTLHIVISKSQFRVLAFIILLLCHPEYLSSGL